MENHKSKIEQVKEIIMNTKQASEIWGLSQDSVKRLCRQGKVASFKLDETDPKSPYIILRNQPNPKKLK
ncbi:helix-turn-helix domain-containing protein [Metabacillus niabensis]|uniref:helix-turn-helix domain-containing protein n=1 Tax=Metabacillus niabensis TaxID=324854 RepID=UPI0039A1CF98